MADTNPTKTGWQSSEFVSHMLLSVGIAVLTCLGDMSDALPIWAKTALSVAGPLALGWMQSQYAKGRTAVKVAMIQSDADAAGVLGAVSVPKP